jgi:hypothetical protein
MKGKKRQVDNVIQDIKDTMLNLNIFQGSFPQRKAKLVALHYSIPKDWRKDYDLELEQLSPVYKPGTSDETEINTKTKTIVLRGHISLTAYLRSLAIVHGWENPDTAALFARIMFKGANPQFKEEKNSKLPKVKS